MPLAKKLKVIQEELGVGEVFASALKQAAGFEGRFFDLAVIKKYFRDNPDFQIRQVYNGRKTSAAARRIREWHQRNRPGQPSSGVDKPDVESLTHA